MKHRFVFLLLISSLSLSAQQNGMLTPKQNYPKAGVENTYTYTPPKNLLIPQKSVVEVIYVARPYSIKNFPLKKTSNGYEFSFKAPDSTQEFVAAITDEHKKIIDNNNDQGYFSVLYDKNNKKFPLTDAITANSLMAIGNALLKLKIPSKVILQLYETEFKINASAKDRFYIPYLNTLYRENKDETKPKMLEYAQALLATTDEKKWINATTIYRILKMNDEQQKTEAKILATYPTGILAKQKAQNDFYSTKEPADMIAKMDAYYKKFNDTATAIKDNFYTSIINSCAAKKDWANYSKYVNLVSDKNKLSDTYNNIAWKLSGESLDKHGEDLDMAKKISSQSLKSVKNIAANPAKYSSMYFFGDQDFKEGMDNIYAAFADTYALILYKLKSYDSAFYYQKIAIKKIENASTDELERYAAYAEKVKGAQFIKTFLENKIVSGKGTPAMNTQLKAIYKKMKLSDAAYDKIISKGLAITKEKLANEIKDKIKNYKATDFSLKSLQGDTVSLSSLKGKVVVLDFWATWCGPCKASFPAMQTAVTKYKDDKDVAFVFIDTWEHKEPKPMKEETAKFIEDNKYSFLVLLDEKDKTVTDYKVDGIPTKFIIDKNGNVKYTSVGYSENANELVEELSTMIENAKK